MKVWPIKCLATAGVKNSRNAATSRAGKKASDNTDEAKKIERPLLKKKEDDPRAKGFEGVPHANNPLVVGDDAAHPC